MATQLRLYESMSKSPTGGAHANVMIKSSEVPVKLLGGPEGAMFIVKEQRV